MPPDTQKPRPSHAAAYHLSNVCPRFAALIGRVGPPGLTVVRRRDLYEALIRAIAHQQLHGKAAEAILNRFVALKMLDAGCEIGCHADSLHRP